MVFPGDEEPQEECTVLDEFAELMRREYGSFDLHTLSHILYYTLLQMRHHLPAMDLVLAAANTAGRIETVFRMTDYTIDYGDGPVKANLPEFRAGIEREMDDVDIPDTLPEWLTREEGDSE